MSFGFKACLAIIAVGFIGFICGMLLGSEIQHTKDVKWYDNSVCYSTDFFTIKGKWTDKDD